MHPQNEMDYPPVSSTTHPTSSLSSSGVPGPSAAAGTGPSQLHSLPRATVRDLRHD